ncbi:MAG: amidohydrolase [Rhodospirillales bacterium]|nr:amidohydrolase [Rhodospirillales bacterium]
MIIDIFTHVFPRKVFDRVAEIDPNIGWMGPRALNMPQLHDMDARFRVMDEFGDYRQIISMLSPPIEDVTTPEQGRDISRLANDCMADLVAAYPNRFTGFVAAISLNDLDYALVELERAIKDLGAVGVQIYTDVKGKPIDHPDFEPVFAAMSGYGLPIWLHPTRTPDFADYPSEDESRFDAWQILGWPYMTGVTMMRLVMGGIYARHPGLKIITHHLGGIIPYNSTRVAQSMFRMMAQGEGDGTHMRRPPDSQLKMFYADTAIHGALATLECGLDYFGVSNVVFATDAPFGTIRDDLKMMDRIDLDAESKQRILSGNALRIMKRA